MIGRNVPIPMLRDVASGPEELNANLLNAANVATGGNFFDPSVFSLGLGPWMGAAILWRFLFIGKIARGRNIPEESVERARNALMVVLAVVQAISLASRFEVTPLSWGPFAQPTNAQILAVVVLAAGGVVVAWLAKQNEELGLGGITMFILFQIVITTMRNVGSLGDVASDSRTSGILWLVAVACIGVVLVGVVAGNAEIRLHVNRVSIDSGFTGVSYLPIKLNPAGAAPIMYALALLAIPQYVVHVVAQAIPGDTGRTEEFFSAWGLGSPVGFSAYIVLLFGLTIFFGLFSVDPKGTARRMNDDGSYFDHVAPGRSTRSYIRRRVVVLSAASGVFLVLLTGVPLYFVGDYPHLQWLLMAPGTLMILLGLLWMLEEEITDTVIGTRYSFALPSSAVRATS